MRLTVQSIGVIHSPFHSIEEMPIQPLGASGVEGTVEVDPVFSEGLEDLSGFSHIYLFYYFHLAVRTELRVTPFMDTSSRGVFSTRSPLRPNHIGLSIVKLLEINENRLRIEGVDIVDKTPLLDIKPYIVEFDGVEGSSSGWFKADRSAVGEKRSDSRFG
ncbi:MAG: tRNA (N6-threonylcarbamoyladenosine(37)-N6)-methyltransferase TrmO [Thermodesulfobacteriota bacterium]